MCRALRFCFRAPFSSANYLVFGRFIGVCADMIVSGRAWICLFLGSCLTIVGRWIYHSTNHQCLLMIRRYVHADAFSMHVRVGMHSHVHVHCSQCVYICATYHAMWLLACVFGVVLCGGFLASQFGFRTHLCFHNHCSIAARNICWRYCGEIRLLKLCSNCGRVWFPALAFERLPFNC